MMRKIIAFVKAIHYHIYCSYRLWQFRRKLVDDVIYTTERNVRICVYPGKKTQSPFDFIVRYTESGKRERTPKHVHLIVEMYVKHAFNPELTMKLRDHILTMLDNIHPVNTFPPQLQYFRPEHIEDFRELDHVGEFTVEFLLVVSELIGIQEKTNYPKGSLTQSLYADFGVKDRFSVIQKAVWRG
ncbi:MAG: hypothetical protein HPY54_13140 [Chthonomonadetes bacterium]|nr:hypothetical protein [Chthonomonadetes bacterium]